MAKDQGYVLKLTEYLKRNLKKGYTKESLKWALVNQGHSKIEVEKALKLVEQQLADEAPILETKPEIKVEIIPGPKESFFKRFLKNFKFFDYH